MVPVLASILLCAALTIGVGAARADEAATAPEEPTGLLSQDSLTGSWGGLRTELQDSGIAIGATETSDLFGIVRGGTRRGAVYEGRLEADLDVDLEKILEISSLVLHANAYQIHGRGPSANHLGNNLTTLSNIEAVRSTRLFDLWIQKGFFNSALSIRLGQIATDDEFMTSQFAGGLINATFGTPPAISANLPSGGLVYPLATPGIRVKDALSTAFSIQGAVLNGDPAGGGSSVVDPQIRDASGTDFNIGRSLLTIIEAQYAPEADGGATPLSTYKLGVWYHSGTFEDPARDRHGLSLADPRRSGDPRLHNSDWGLYATVDQVLYRQADNENRWLGAFLRVAGGPDDRNLISLYLDAGFAWNGPIDGRDDDLASLGIAYAEIGGQARRYDDDLRRLGLGTAIRDYEMAVELNYQFALAPWWSIQPDLQFVLRPTQAVLRPAPGSTVRSGDAIVVGMRTSIRF